MATGSGWLAWSDAARHEKNILAAKYAAAKGFQLGFAARIIHARVFWRTLGLIAGEPRLNSANLRLSATVRICDGPSVTPAIIDAIRSPRYSVSILTISGSTVAVSSIQLGQVWRNDSDGQDYLVTKVYNEVFAQYAMLRPAGITAPDAPTVRIKIAKGPGGASLPGYTFTQDGSF